MHITRTLAICYLRLTVSSVALMSHDVRVGCVISILTFITQKLFIAC